MAPPRGCGHRVAGSAYIECPVGNVGLPVEHFLVDTPIEIDAGTYGLSPIGIKIIERQGIFHVWDIVGSEFYPNVADFVEEVRRLGLSRKIAVTSDFKKLTPQSKIILLHARAYDMNFAKYPKATLKSCPKRVCGCRECLEIANDHTMKKADKCLKKMCAACWWHNLDDTTPNPPFHIRGMPAFQYTGHPMPTTIKTPKYKLAIFMRLPINNFAVIRDLSQNKHEQAMAKVSESTIPVELKDE